VDFKTLSSATLESFKSALANRYERSWWLPLLNAHPWTDPIRTDPRYRKLILDAGLPSFG